MLREKCRFERDARNASVGQGKKGSVVVNEPLVATSLLSRAGVRNASLPPNGGGEHLDARFRLPARSEFRWIRLISGFGVALLSPQRRGAFVEDVKVSAIAEHSPPTGPGDFPDDAKTLKISQRGVDGGRRQTRANDKVVGGDEWMLLEQILNA